MGAMDWGYLTEYNSDINFSLQKLRKQEFEAGRYSGDGGDSYGEGARHDSIEDAMEDADADGTCSILDIEKASLEPDDGLEPPLSGVAYPLSEEKLKELFGTNKPSAEDVDGNHKLYEMIDRGCCIYVHVYNGGSQPSHTYWAGYSYD
jgi:hypothetical protein